MDTITKMVEGALRDQHRKLWLWLAQNPDKEKRDWPGWETEEVIILTARFPTTKRARCFACYKGDDALICGKTCPVQQWIPGHSTPFGVACMPSYTLFGQWRAISSSFARRTSLALHIAFAWK